MNYIIDLAPNFNLREKGTEYSRMSSSQKITYLAHEVNTWIDRYNEVVTALNNINESSNNEFDENVINDIYTYANNLVDLYEAEKANNEALQKDVYMYSVNTEQQYELSWDDTSAVYTEIARINLGKTNENTGDTAQVIRFDENNNETTENVELYNIIYNGYVVLSGNNEVIALQLDFVADETTEYDVYSIGSDCIATLLDPARKVTIKKMN